MTSEAMSICERCSNEVPSDEINICNECDMDGLCNECYATHDCQGK